MLQEWSKDGKSGNIFFPEGEVVYQQPKGKVVKEPLYKSYDGKWYIEVEDDKLQEVLYNPFNGYCYRQD